MSQSKPSVTTVARDAALALRGFEKYVLRLYVVGTSEKSLCAIANIKKICEEHLHGRYQLQVVDLYQQPQLARGEQIFAVPTLIKKLPLPLRHIVGDLSNTERVLVGLDIRPEKPMMHSAGK